MVHEYQVIGMTCTSCETTVKSSLSTVENIVDIEVSKPKNSAKITMKTHISIDKLQSVLNPKYKIVPIGDAQTEIKQQQPALTHQFNWSDFAIWKRAGFNTLNCLIGCSIGDFGMVIFLQYFYPDTSMMTQMVLAIIAGLMTSVTLETMILRYREKLIWNMAFKTAIGMSFLSMVAMEIAMTTTDFMMTSGKMAFTDPGYWLAFIPSAIVGFLVPLPYNYYQLKKHNKACH